MTYGAISKTSIMNLMISEIMLNNILAQRSSGIRRRERRKQRFVWDKNWLHCSTLWKNRRLCCAKFNPIKNLHFISSSCALNVIQHLIQLIQSCNALKISWNAKVSIFEHEKLLEQPDHVPDGHPLKEAAEEVVKLSSYAIHQPLSPSLPPPSPSLRHPLQGKNIVDLLRKHTLSYTSGRVCASNTQMNTGRIAWRGLNWKIRGIREGISFAWVINLENNPVENFFKKLTS